MCTNHCIALTRVHTGGYFDVDHDHLYCIYIHNIYIYIHNIHIYIFIYSTETYTVFFSFNIH